MPLLVAILLAWLATPATAADMVSVRNRTMPDPVLTPGVATLITAEELCKPTYRTRDARHVTAKDKATVFRRYGLKGNRDCEPDPHGRRCEIDHLISLELGGANDIPNLWPQPFLGKFGAAQKDKIETALHRLVCASAVTLDDAQQDIRTDWIRVYIRYFGEEK